MLTLKATKAVRDLMGLKPADLVAEPTSAAPLDTWYVNVFTVERRKALVLLNERTLLSFVVRAKTKARNRQRITGQVPQKSRRVVD